LISADAIPSAKEELASSPCHQRCRWQKKTSCQGSLVPKYRGEDELVRVKYDSTKSSRLGGLLVREQSLAFSLEM